jgi:hypothetical protein
MPVVLRSPVKPVIRLLSFYIFEDKVSQVSKGASALGVSVLRTSITSKSIVGQSSPMQAELAGLNIA